MTYETTRGYPPDFEVQYRFFTKEEGGRTSGPPSQGYRSDWAYDGDDISKTGIYMIHPEFLDTHSIPLPMGSRASNDGKAFMWILIPEMRETLHRNKIAPGVKGYLMEGGKRVAEATVTRIIGLMDNAPTMPRTIIG